MTTTCSARRGPRARPGRRALSGTLPLLTLALLAPRMSSAQAMVDCDSLPNPVYLQVGDTQEPLMKALGQRLRNSTVRPMTLVYTTAGSCTNVEAIRSGLPITTNPRYVPSRAEDPAWTPSAASPTCRIRAGGVPIDVANSALITTECNEDPLPPGLAEFVGPVQPYVFVVPTASSQTAITAEEAYFVFGFGANGQVEPWTDEAFYFIRDNTRSTLLALAANIRVPGPRWRGTRLMRSSEVVTSVAQSAQPERTIGILGAEIYDRNRQALKALAFQAYGQRRAYWPDSSPTARDKRTTRDGHYVPWSPTIYLTRVDAQGRPARSDVGYLVDLILTRSTTTTPDFDALRTIAEVGLVPECAMRVTRSREGGDLSLFTPEIPCGCAFEAVVDPAAAARCVACTDDGPCGAGKCRFGYCEAR